MHTCERCGGVINTVDGQYVYVNNDDESQVCVGCAGELTVLALFTRTLAPPPRP